MWKKTNVRATHQKQNLPQRDNIRHRRQKILSINKWILLNEANSFTNII
jgi:hypothetical protein